MSRLGAVLLTFARELRGAGVPLTTSELLTFREAVSALPDCDLTDLYWAGRGTLVKRPEDLPPYQRVFEALFLRADASAEPEDRPVLASLAPVASDAAEQADGGGEAGGLLVSASEREVLRDQRFDQMTDAELERVQALMGRMRMVLPQRRSRRRVRARRGPRLDLRRSVRAALSTDGEILERRYQRRRTRARPLVLLLDVSGSMTGYSRVLLQFAFLTRLHAAHIEIFCFGTRLTRVTAALDRCDPMQALERAAAEVVDWEGGTRIGASLMTLNRRWGRTGLLRGAVVLICSDGLDRGDPEVLRREMARLARHAHGIVWANPLAGGHGYEPVQQGMRAALPHVDVFLSGRNLRSLEQLLAVLEDELHGA